MKIRERDFTLLLAKVGYCVTLSNMQSAVKRCTAKSRNHWGFHPFEAYRVLGKARSKEGNGMHAAFSHVVFHTSSRSNSRLTVIRDATRLTVKKGNMDSGMVCSGWKATLKLTRRKPIATLLPVKFNSKPECAQSYK